ncbi:hypothetical protein DYE49_03940 [Treponema rectale]|uniref:Uncharacterized protein n=1 Tax=Treponema rectale TaxID=744512 RepID=A0A7M1XJ33_9SPIR|nr:hypothetical protein DYE49_03940 [Treponema rectale]
MEYISRNSFAQPATLAAFFGRPSFILESTNFEMNDSKNLTFSFPDLTSHAYEEIDQETLPVSIHDSAFILLQE